MSEQTVPVSVDAWQEPTTLVALDGGQGTINVPSWAPDGSAFAFVDYPFDQQTERGPILRRSR